MRASTWHTLTSAFLQVDGCTEYQLFWHIGLPLGRTIVATLAFLADQRLTPLNEPESALGSLFITVPVLPVFVFAQKYIVQGLAAGAVKE